MRSYTPLILTLLFYGCGSGETVIENSNNIVSQNSFNFSLPSYIPTPIVPDDNPMSSEKIELGRHLFYDKSLSANQTQSCESCHFQKLAFSDGLPNAIGSTGMHHPRSAQALINTAYYPSLTWANPALVTIEKQMEGPLFNESVVELGLNDSNKDEVLRRFSTNPLYQELYKKAYPDESEPFSINNTIKAIASFVRTLTSFNSAFDRYQYLGDKTALSESAKRGMNLFFGEKAECFHCHSGFNFTDSVKYVGVSFIDMPFHNTGLYNIDGKGSYPSNNTGVFEITSQAKDMGRFRVQTLRNIEFTAPYMHDGSIKTLREVVDFYSAGGRVIESGEYAGDGRTNPYKSDLIVKIDLSEDEKNDLVEFLKSLSDYEFINNPKLSNPFK